MFYVVFSMCSELNVTLPFFHLSRSFGQPFHPNTWIHKTSKRMQNTIAYPEVAFAVNILMLFLFRWDGSSNLLYLQLPATHGTYSVSKVFACFVPLHTNNTHFHSISFMHLCFSFHFYVLQNYRFYVFLPFVTI